jgi:hypothetical protein
VQDLITEQSVPTTGERAHELSADCWCEPEVIDYSGDEEE